MAPTTTPPTPTAPDSAPPMTAGPPAHNPSPDPTEHPSLRSLLSAEDPGFSNPSPDTPPDPETTTTTKAEGPTIDPRAAGASSNGSANGRDPSGTPIPGLGPLLASTAKASAYAPMIAALVQAASIVPDRLRTKHTHAWIMHDDEAAAIAQPLARIAARHSPANAMTGETSDVLDGLEAAVLVGNYGVRSYLQEVDTAGAERVAGADPGDLGPGV